MPTAAELRGLDDADLVARRESLEEELFNLRFQNATGQLDNYGRLAEVRRDIARANTVIREREITAAETDSEDQQ